MERGRDGGVERGRGETWRAGGEVERERGKRGEGERWRREGERESGRESHRKRKEGKSRSVM